MLTICILRLMCSTVPVFSVNFARVFLMYWSVSTCFARDLTSLKCPSLPSLMRIVPVSSVLLGLSSKPLDGRHEMLMVKSSCTGMMSRMRWETRLRRHAAAVRFNFSIIPITTSHLRQLKRLFRNLSLNQLKRIRPKNLTRLLSSRKLLNRKTLKR